MEDSIRFFSIDARIARPRLLIGIVIGLALGWLGVLILRERTGIVTSLVGGVAGFTIAKLVVEAGRRRHDMGAGAAGALTLLALGVVGIGASLVYALGTGDFPLHYLALGLFALLWAGLLLRPGENAMNRYGAPPAGVRPSFGSRGDRTGLILAVLLTAAGVALGGGANLWREGLAEQRVQDQAAAARTADTPDATGNAESLDNLEAIYEGQTR